MESLEDQPLFMQGSKQEHEKTFESLGDRMKQYEANNDDKRISPTEAFVVRLDGHSFSAYVKPLHRPFDANFVLAMNRTAGEILQEFKAQTVYTHSDEITIVFDRACSEEDLASPNERLHKCHSYNGRYQKLLSLMAGYCSVRFNYHLASLIVGKDASYSEQFTEKLQHPQKYFDARIITFDNKSEEIVNHQIWRSCYDCYRNCVSTYARSMFSHKELTNKNTKEMIEMMTEKDFDWSTVPLYFKHGSYCKKEKFDKVNEDGTTSVRTRIIWKTFKISFSDQMVRTMLAPYWSADDQLGYSEDITEMVLTNPTTVKRTIEQTAVHKSSNEQTINHTNTLIYYYDRLKTLGNHTMNTYVSPYVAPYFANSRFSKYFTTVTKTSSTNAPT
jgi:tRNA(His) 5'-end guanylyltransferase